jgi:hypothetical protein
VPIGRQCRRELIEAHPAIAVRIRAGEALRAASLKVLQIHRKPRWVIALPTFALYRWCSNGGAGHKRQHPSRSNQRAQHRAPTHSITHERIL